MKMVNWRSTSETSSLILRVPVGITMVLIGISAYRDFAPFVANVTDGLGFLSPFGTVWAFLLPALLIFGGGFLTIGRYGYIAALTGGTALATIPIGLLLKNTITGVSLPDMLAASYPSMVWIVAFYLALNRMPDWESAAGESEE
jgi:hypothetical protein